MVRELVYKYFVKEFYSLEINFGDREAEYRILYLKRQASKLNIIEQTIENEEGVFKKLKKDLPLILAFSGKRIINKVVPNETNYLQKILFNKDPDSYYIQEYTKKGNMLLSVARKKDIDEYLDKFKNHNFNILDFSLGPFVLESLTHLFSETKIFSTEDFKYDPLKSELITEADPLVENENHNIGGDTILNTHILAFATFLCYVHPEGFSKNFQDYIDKQSESYSYRIAFGVTAKSVIVLFLILLSISYAVRSHYIGKSTEIQQESLMNSQVLNEIATLTKDRDYKKNIISNSSLGSTDFLSFYISQITLDLPEDILLKRLEVFPSKTSSNPNEKIQIKPNTIIIDGITPSNLSVNEWVNLLDEYKWIQKVELLSYSLEKEEYVFKLNITL
ncbi:MULTISPECIES: PilN domain-containing protein [Aequorivita]|uniref:PilN domain-containing protein n=1 Tax=Aequorivita iocasae TaxID=2803865 RepID=A0ABX7DTP1_9FLAO|nr:MULTISPECIES: PilN domain-containing protein [Aequorivita]QQX76509.1 PilN domain-containing protein [Aequorivita iocasae]UCA55981.1 PilN domain-containing protein [Aequorivita sp. F7]